VEAALDEADRMAEEDSRRKKKWYSTKKK